MENLATPEILLAVFAFVAISLVATIFLLWKLLAKQKENTALVLQQEMQKQMQSEINSFREELSRNLQDSSNNSQQQIYQLSSQLNERMKETNNSLSNTQNSVGNRLDNAAKVISQLQGKLGNLEESSKRILEVGQGLKELKDIMGSPKLRGNMGEFFLEDLLRQILPANHYSMQYSFKSGEMVDATIHIGDSMVCVDSKFPLETFLRIQQIPDDEPELKKKAKKEFITTIKKHADSIAKKYILPDEGTFDFAFMYIPAENVYYETIIQDDIMDAENKLYSWLLKKKVIPVSPNSLYAYMQVIILGLKGMRIQESAKTILQSLDRLSGDLKRFRTDHELIGKHLKNANNSYENSTKRLDKFSDRYQQLSHLEEKAPEQLL